MNFTQVLSFRVGGFEVTVQNEVIFEQNQTDNNELYEKEYLLGEHATSKHGVVVSYHGKKITSCALIASGGPSIVHENSALIHELSCIVAVGRYACSLSVPSLELEWQTEVDEATCFGVYKLPNHEGLVSHGELQIARLTHSGEILWRTSGGDIFTGDFTVNERYIEAFDFYGARYLINLEDGSSEITNS